MKGNITGENDERVGLYVDDNNEVEHWIEMEFDGEIKYHEQDGYADKPANRTPTESEHFQQAREYARHYVYQQRDYEPFPVEKNLPGIKRVRDAISELPADRFRDLFEEAYKQVDGKGPGGFYGPVPLPEIIDETGWVLFMIDVYLDGDGDIEAISDIHLRYADEQGEITNQWNNDPFENRKPDARLQLVPDLVTSLEEFREFLDYHLRCQIRDCYLCAGLEPPAEFKVLGHGIHELGGRYNRGDIDIYEKYHKHHADIPGYSLDYDYGLGEYGKSITKLQSLTADDEELNQAIETVAHTGEGMDDVIHLLAERGYDDPETVVHELFGTKP